MLNWGVESWLDKLWRQWQNYFVGYFKSHLSKGKSWRMHKLFEGNWKIIWNYTSHTFKKQVSIQEKGKEFYRIGTKTISTKKFLMDHI